MKKLLVVFLMGTMVSASAQVKKTTSSKSVSKTTVPVKVLKTLNDSASYAVGLSVVNFYRQQGISNLNTAVLVRAINDVMGKKSLLLSDEEANSCMMKLIGQQSASKAKPVIAAGEKFLAANKTKAGVKTTESGLQYEIIRQGTVLSLEFQILLK
jgi:FKBP-type peptidyl-prolyl cis-trans isomerase FklB